MSLETGHREYWPSSLTNTWNLPRSRFYRKPELAHGERNPLRGSYNAAQYLSERRRMIWVGCEGRFALAVCYAALFWPEFAEFEGYILHKDFSEKSLRGFESQQSSTRKSVEWLVNHW
jgi:hypothetical protein